LKRRGSADFADDADLKKETTDFTDFHRFEEKKESADFADDADLKSETTDFTDLHRFAAAKKPVVCGPSSVVQ